MCSYVSSSCGPSNSMLSSLHSTPPKSIPATATVSTVETDNCMIMDPPAKETNKEDSDSYKATNRQLILKNSH